MPDQKRKSQTDRRCSDCPCRVCKRDELCNKKPGECKPFSFWFKIRWRQFCKGAMR